MREVGRVLQEGRLALGLQIADVARVTCISPHYIRAMEDGNFQIIPKVFDKGYLKIYAKFLALDLRLILELYDQRRNQPIGHLTARESA